MKEQDEKKLLNTLKSIDNTLKSIEQMLRSRPLNSDEVFERALSVDKENWRFKN